MERKHENQVKIMVSNTSPNAKAPQNFFQYAPVCLIFKLTEHQQRWFQVLLYLTASAGTDTYMVPKNNHVFSVRILLHVAMYILRKRLMANSHLKSCRRARAQNESFIHRTKLPHFKKANMFLFLEGNLLLLYTQLPS